LVIAQNNSITKPNNPKTLVAKLSEIYQTKQLPNFLIIPKMFLVAIQTIFGCHHRLEMLFFGCHHW
jgi:hypothetical protein